MVFSTETKSLVDSTEVTVNNAAACCPVSGLLFSLLDKSHCADNDIKIPPHNLHLRPFFRTLIHVPHILKPTAEALLISGMQVGSPSV